MPHDKRRNTSRSSILNTLAATAGVGGPGGEVGFQGVQAQREAEQGQARQAMEAFFADRLNPASAEAQVAAPRSVRPAPVPPLPGADTTVSRQDDVVQEILGDLSVFQTLPRQERIDRVAILNAIRGPEGFDANFARDKAERKQQEALFKADMEDRALSREFNQLALEEQKLKIDALNRAALEGTPIEDQIAENELQIRLGESNFQRFGTTTGEDPLLPLTLDQAVTRGGLEADAPDRGVSINPFTSARNIFGTFQDALTNEDLQQTLISDIQGIEGETGFNDLVLIASEGLNRGQSIAQVLAEIDQGISSIPNAPDGLREAVLQAIDPTGALGVGPTDQRSFLSPGR